MLRLAGYSVLLSACLALALAGFSQDGRKEPMGASQTQSREHHAGEEMIDLGARKLQIVRGGQGSPTVVFEYGLGGSMGGLLKFLPAVTKYTSAVSYSRAGYGASDLVSGPRTAEAVADDLEQMLTHAGFKPPYVLVGYSLGALYVRVFAIKYPNEVAGLVLVDGTPERYLLDLMAIDPQGVKRELKQLAASNAVGFTDLKGPLGARGEWQGLYQIWTSGSLGVAGSLPDVQTAGTHGLKHEGASPLAAKIAKVKRREHAEVFQSTSYGMHIVTSKSGHDFRREPEIIANAIKWVVDVARTPK